MLDQISPSLLILAAVNASLLFINTFILVLLILREKQVSHRELGTTKEVNDVLKTANRKASKILFNASKKAKQLLVDTHVVLEDLRQEMRNSFTSAKDENVQLLKTQIQNLRQDNQNFIDQLNSSLQANTQEIKDDLLNQARQETQTFIEEFKHQTFSAQKDIKDQLNQEFIQAKKDIATFRDQQRQAITNNINHIVQDVVGDVLGKTLTTEDHQKLILDALEQAKREQVFNHE